MDKHNYFELKYMLNGNAFICILKRLRYANGLIVL